MIINGKGVQYSEGVTNVDGVKIVKTGDKIKIRGKKLKYNSYSSGQQLKGALKANAVEGRAFGIMQNITTNKEKYMHIADVKGNNHITINGGISNVKINGEGTDFGEESDGSKTVEITQDKSGNYRQINDTVITIDGNSVTTSGGVYYG
uniref:Lipoprotein n=1 Tax=Meloidogyne hapla TaxID=6305 RepID=A0A1I8BSF5_MELHA